MSYTWETDFEISHIFGVQNTSAMCNLTIPEITGQAQASDNRPGNVSLTYNDFSSGCLLRRIWIGTDTAGNIAQLVQNIDIATSSGNTM